MTTQSVTVILYPGRDGGYSAIIPPLPSLHSHGDTVREALDMAKESVELMLEDVTEDDLEGLEMSWVPHVVVGEVEVEVPAGVAKVVKKAAVKA